MLINWKSASHHYWLYCHIMKEYGNIYAMWADGDVYCIKGGMSLRRAA